MSAAPTKKCSSHARPVVGGVSVVRCNNTHNCAFHFTENSPNFYKKTQLIYNQRKMKEIPLFFYFLVVFSFFLSSVTQLL